jgi:putative transposase
MHNPRVSLESSHWLNKQNLIQERFSWQDEYFAVSIGESQVHAIRQYIRDQQIHHRRKTFQQEYQEFIKNYRFE